MSNAGSDERLGDAVGRLQGEVAELRRSRRRLAEAAQDDRRTIERTLHDGVQQHLVALAIGLRRLSGLLEGDPAEARALLDELELEMRQALDETADLAQGIYPSALGSAGLASSLRSAAEAAGVTLVLDVPTAVGHPPEYTAAVHWACVAALSSASPGSEATISVHDAGGALTFEIAIAGRLTDDPLERMRDGIEALDGRVTVERLADDGSRVHGWLPLSR